MAMKKPLTIIGRAEKIRFPDLGGMLVPAKVDTGADISTLWATGVHEVAEGLEFTPFGSGSDHYSAAPVVLPKGKYRLTRIANSFGVKEMRYVVKLRVEVKGRIIRASFSLSNRSTKTYPVLLGRRLLHGKFLVDVAAGSPLLDKENEGKEKLRLSLGAKHEPRKDTSI